MTSIVVTLETKPNDTEYKKLRAKSKVVEQAMRNVKHKLYNEGENYEQRFRKYLKDGDIP